MKEVLLPPLRSHVPGVSASNPKPTWHLPIHVYTAEGINLDFGPLLLFDTAVLDAASLDYILTSDRKDLAPLANSLTILRDEGYVTIRDFGSDLDKHRELITSHVDQLIKEPLDLRAPLLRGIDGYRETLPKLSVAGIDCNSDVLQVGFGMHLFMMQRYGRIDPDEKVRLDRLMTSGKKSWTQKDIEEVQAIIAPTITYLYQNFVLGEMYGMPFMDVDYTSEMYTNLRQRLLTAFNGKTSSAATQVIEAQNLFRCVIPELRPDTPEKMLAFLRSSAVHDFRDYIANAAKTGESITEDDYRLLLLRTLNAERKFQGIKEGIAWGERALSFIPGAGLIVPIISALAEKITHTKTTKQNEWVYALIKASKIGNEKSFANYPRSDRKSK